MKYKILNYILPILTLFIYTIPAIAQPNPPDDGDDPSAAPIDDWVMSLLMIGILIGTYLVFNYQRKHVSSIEV